MSSQGRYGAPAVGSVKIAAGVTPGHPHVIIDFPGLPPKADIGIVTAGLRASSVIDG